MKGHKIIKIWTEVKWLIIYICCLIYNLIDIIDKSYVTRTISNGVQKGNFLA